MTKDEIIKIGLKYTKWQLYERYAMLYDRMVECLPLRGDVVECGVALGGSAAIFGGVIADHPKFGERDLHLFDTFEGLPPPTKEDGPKAVGMEGHCAGPIDSVCAALAEVGLKSYSIVPGRIEETLRDPEISGLDDCMISLLHIDVDWYEGTKVCLELMPKMVKGGVVIVDDYGFWPGCKQACDEWFSKHGKPSPFNYGPSSSPQRWWTVR